jgi:hypothetical protein
MLFSTSTIYLFIYYLLNNFFLKKKMDDETKAKLALIVGILDEHAINRDGYRELAQLYPTLEREYKGFLSTCCYSSL